MTGQQLKNSILQLAIQGKLVPQDPNDEPASKLLARIRKKKEQLVKDGKLKKKDLVTTPITDEEKPFDIPESWEWCRLGEIVRNRDSERIPLSVSERQKQKHKRYDYYGPGGAFDKVEDYLFDKRLLLIGEDGANLLTRSKPNAFFAEGKYWVNNHVHVIDAFLEDDILLDYIAMRINGMSLADYVTGTAQPKMNQEKMNSILIPLPPLHEQNRIVAKIEELMPLVEQYGKSQEKLEALNKSLPEALKKSILQEAIMGRLVPQDPTEEPASALLARIRKEKEQLVKDGKLKKKDLVTTPITDEEKPFDIPESWEWCRLGDCVSNRAGLAYSKGDLDKKSNDMIRVLRGGNISYGKWKKEENDVMISREFVKDELLLKKGTFITPAVTSLDNMGKTALIEEDLYDTVVGGFVLMLQAYLKDELLLKYLLYFFASAYYKEYCKSITNKSGQAFYNISRSKLMDMLIPLPPLSEQHRIVKKIEELFDVLK